MLYLYTDGIRVVSILPVFLFLVRFFWPGSVCPNFWDKSFLSIWDESFPPDFKGGSSRPDFRRELFGLINLGQPDKK